MNVCQAIARRVAQLANLRKAEIARLFKESEIEDILTALVKEHMPSGSGFDNGTTLIDAASSGAKLVFATAFHHMNEHGMYDGWTTHTVIVTPAFDGFDLRVTGRNRNDIKDYIADAFHAALSRAYVEN